MKVNTPELQLHRRRDHLKMLLNQLEKVAEITEKLEILNALPEVDVYFTPSSLLKDFIWKLPVEKEYVIKATFAIGQGPRIFEGAEQEPLFRLQALVDELMGIERFYSDSGGIIGYQYLVLTLLLNRASSTGVELKPPQGVNLSEETANIKKAVILGIQNQGRMAEIYPVGGAADRLQLKDEKTDEGLPAARLNFLGKPLLEGVVNDLQAREYLHYKLFGKQLTTPIAMMTSKAHQNHKHIRAICIQNNWFGRPKESFRFVTQPSVPTFTSQGNWCLQRPLKLLLKPGGHGMLWKLLKQGKVFDWLKATNCRKALIRQINNPMAAIDYGLLAFLGIGHQEDKTFGFASCERLINAHEGINVIKSIEGKRVLTNVEYCDFAACGIEDKPLTPDGKYSRFPSNTNILFADIEKVEEVALTHPHPGLLINFRKGYHYHSPEHKEEIARLETTMQNIADAFVVSKEEPLPTYLTFYERRKTISTTKRKSTSKEALLETPEGCYYDYMLNAKELLENYCHMQLPPFPDEKTFAEVGPSFLFSYHPALGPLYSIIGQKVQGGVLAHGAELQLEIADLSIKNLQLDGSLLIQATQPMGHFKHSLLRYSDETGQCQLTNVVIKNAGIDWDEDHLFWKHEVKRKEALKIVLHGHSRFIADDVVIEGDLTLEVPHGMKMTAKKDKGRVIFITEPLKDQDPFWTYHITADSSIKLV